MNKQSLKRVFLVLLGLLLSIALLSGCSLFNQKLITINKIDKVSLQVGEDRDVSVKTMPGDVSVKAVSSKTSVATVSINKNILTIVGKAAGEAEMTITATKSGYKAASLKFKVIVSNLSTEANIISISSLPDNEVIFGTMFTDIDLPENVEVTLDDQTKRTLEINWPEGDYDGNTAGTYNLEGSLILVEGITNTSDLKAEIKVIVPEPAKGNVKSVETFVDKVVPYGTTFAELGLPERVKVTLDEGSERYLFVDWVSSNYDGSTIGTYSIEGSLILVEGITNTSGLKAEIKVIVPEPIIGNVKSVETFADKEVLFGTEFANIGLPDSVEVTLDDETKQPLYVNWIEANYDGNIAGTYDLEGSLILENGITNSNNLKANIKVIVPVAVTGNIQSVEPVIAKKVSHRTEFADIDLPKTVKVTLDEASDRYLAVDWASGNYDGNSAGEVYNLVGNLVLSDGITNTLDLNATAEIIINNPPEITSLIPDDSTIRENEEITFTVFANDLDGDSLTYQWKIDGELINVNYGDMFTFFEDLGTYKLNVEVSDGFNATVSETRTIEVNALPEITSLTSSETMIKVGEKIVLDVQVIDNENDELTYIWILDSLPLPEETGSSMNWIAPELGTYCFQVDVSDDGGQSFVSAEILITVVEEFIPEIKSITGPEIVVVNQQGVKFLAEYDHRDPEKELTLSWEADAGIIVHGQDTGEIEWIPPSEESYCQLTFTIDDGVNMVSDYKVVTVEKPSIHIMGLDETVKANEEYEISINVFPTTLEAQISATMTVGELRPNFMAFNIATYLWTAPETPGEVMLTVDAIVNGEKFSAVKNFVVIENDPPVTENDPPIIDDFLVNQNSIDQDQFLILNAHELYDFEIKTTDPDGDELEINWCFEPINLSEIRELFGSKVEYTANEAGLTFCYTSVNDKIHFVENQMYIIFEDGSESEIADQTKVATIEMILDEFEFAFEQNDLERILNYAHPDTKDTLRNDLEEDILYADCDTMDQIDRYLITFDPSSSIYTTYVLFKVHIGTITANDMWPLFFKADNNGEIKLYEVW